MPILEVQNVTKRFGALTALDSVSVTFTSGEIHAVLGENGAGKSTLMSVLSGFVLPDSGKVLLDGASIPLGRAFDVKRMGIEMIHQHFTLVSAFTVAENLALARLSGLAEPSDVMNRAAPGLAAADRLGWTVDANQRTGDLAVGEQQRLEILKALGGDANVLIFDEPTAVLAPDEVDDLLRVFRQLRDEGRVVILIAHKLSEVLAVADRVTVLRRGKWVATALRADVDAEKLAEWMVGDLPPSASRRTETTSNIPGLKACELDVLGDRGEVAVKGANFSIHQGEIVGIGGVDGNGQIELAESIVGLRPVKSGRLQWAGDTLSPDLSIGYVPADRQGDGLAMGMSVEENFLLGGYRRLELTRGPFLIGASIRKWAEKLVQKFEIKVSNVRAKVSALSGGNQQKVVVSRTLDANPSLLVVVNPTRGLDLKATEFVHRQILSARDQGAAVLLISTDLDELYALADRTAFMSRGVVTEGRDARALLGGAI